MGLILSIGILLLFLFQFQASRATDSIVVDNLAAWRTPILHVGDSLVFQHEHFQNLYLFRSRRAFDLCNFDYATLVYDGKSSHFTWRPLRPGYYYLAAGDSSRSCENGEKVPVRVIAPDPSSGLPTFPAPAPTSGADVSSSPSHTRSTFSSPDSSPAPAPADVAPLQPRERSPTTPAAAPQTPGSVPFISSSPAVPLPVGETDSATILPFPTPGSSETSQVVGMASSPCVAVRTSLLMALALLVAFG